MQAWRMRKGSWRKELCVSLRLSTQASLVKTQVSWLVAGESRDQQTLAVLVFTTDFHIGQPHGPRVPRPVADFEGLVWHLIPGVHQGHGDHAIREGDADEQMPVGNRERAVRVQNVTVVSWMSPAPPGSSPDFSWILIVQRNLLELTP